MKFKWRKLPTSQEKPKNTPPKSKEKAVKAPKPAPEKVEEVKDGDEAEV